MESTLSKTLTVNGRPLTVRHTDKKGTLDILDEVITNDIYGLGALFRAGFRPKLIVDIGAHQGFFARMVRHYWPECITLSFEPEPNALSALYQNHTAKWIVPLALRYDDAKDLYVSPYSGGSVMYDPAVNFSEEIPKSYEHRLVRSTTLETELKISELTGRKIDLLKIDCEGSEWNILCGMKAETRGLVGKMLGEFHHLAGYPYLEKILKNRFSHLKPALLWENDDKAIGHFKAE